MDDRPFYYRLRGRTLGPIDLRQIRQLAQRAQIGRNTDVSRDGLQWAKAGDFAEIFSGGGDSTIDPFPATGGGQGGAATPVAPIAAIPSWYYAVDGVQRGPVDLPTLRQLVATGQLKPSDHVFPEGGAEWLPVGNVPQLAAGGTFAAPAPVINVNVPRQATGQPEGTNGLAIAGFVLSLIGCAPLGMILCLVALNSSNRANRGLAIAGAIIGGLLTLCGCGYLVIVFFAAAANAG